MDNMENNGETETTVKPKRKLSGIRLKFDLQSILLYFCLLCFAAASCMLFYHSAFGSKFTFDAKGIAHIASWVSFFSLIISSVMFIWFMVWEEIKYNSAVRIISIIIGIAAGIAVYFYFRSLCSTSTIIGPLILSIAVASSIIFPEEVLMYYCYVFAMALIVAFPIASIMLGGIFYVVWFVITAVLLSILVKRTNKLKFRKQSLILYRVFSLLCPALLIFFFMTNNLGFMNYKVLMYAFYICTSVLLIVVLFITKQISADSFQKEKLYPDYEKTGNKMITFYNCQEADEVFGNFICIFKNEKFIVCVRAIGFAEIDVNDGDILTFGFSPTAVEFDENGEAPTARKVGINGKIIIGSKVKQKIQMYRTDKKIKFL